LHADDILRGSPISLLFQSLSAESGWAKNWTRFRSTARDLAVYGTSSTLEHRTVSIPEWSNRVCLHPSSPKGGPRVRILFPPPASLSHQCLPRLPPQRPGFCREPEPGRDQRTGRAGPEPARLGCLSLTGIAAVPPREIKAQQREEPRPWPGHPLLRVALQLARRLR
jgi:hypothetical protein